MINANGFATQTGVLIISQSNSVHDFDAGYCLNDPKFKPKLVQTSRIR